MNAYVKYFDKNNKCMNFLVNDYKFQKSAKMYEIKSKIYLKENLIGNQCIMINM